MKAARLHEIGQPLKVKNISEPTLRSGSAIVRILCAHVFSYTRQVINGELGYDLPELPFTPGTGAIAIIEAVADDVFGLEIGQKVFCDPYIYSRKETLGKVRVTIIYPGAIESELIQSSNDEQTSGQLESSFDAIPPTAISQAVRYAIAQPDEVAVNEIVVRPASQEL